MKIFHAAFAALLITGSMFAQPAHAQSKPQESYRTSCTDARVEDRTVCRFAVTADFDRPLAATRTMLASPSREADSGALRLDFDLASRCSPSTFFAKCELLHTSRAILE
jgi:hypothetical protein